jgi:uncharacterized membrane protein YqjE
MTEPVHDHEAKQAGQRAEELGDRSTGELVSRLAEQVSALVREELRLAQLELSEKGKRAGIAVAMFGGGGLLALYGIGAVVAGLVLLLALVMPAWAAALIVGGVLLAVAGVLALRGRMQVRKAAPPVPAQALGSVKEDVAVVKERARR